MSSVKIPPIDTGRIEFESVQALALEPGDALAITLPEGTTHEAMEHGAELLRKAFPENRVLLLPAGTTLHVVKP